MGSALHFILLFSGLWTPAMCVARRFYVVKEQKNWTEAQIYCRGIYTDLATIENKEDMDTVQDLVKGTTGNYWIGMKQKDDHNNINSWVWSDGSNFKYSCWGDKEPNNGGNDNCVELRNEYSYKWNDAGCSNTEINLILVQQPMTWREALMFCRENYVDLVSVNTNETQDWVATVTKHASASNVWMGLRHTCTLGLWYWVNGESVCYQNWAPGNGIGVENCSSVERTGAVQSGSKKWISLPETQQLSFICTI